MDANFDNLLDIDFTDHRIRYSDSLVESLGLTPTTAPLTFEQWLELCHPDDYDRNLELRRLLFETQEDAFSVERRLYCGDGRYRPFRLDAQCVRDDAGRPIGLIGTETDLSQQKIHEERIWRLEEKISGMSARILELQKELDLARAEKAHAAASSQEDAAELRERLHTTLCALDATQELIGLYDSAGRLVWGNRALKEAAKIDRGLERMPENETEVEYHDIYGRKRTFSTRLYPFSKYYGKMEENLVLLSDVTEVREREEEMLRLRRLLGLRLCFELVAPDVGADIANRESSRDETLRSGSRGEALRSNSEIGCSSGFAQEWQSADEILAVLETSPDKEGCDLIDAKEILDGYLNGALRSFSVSGALPTRASQLEAVRLSDRSELEVGVLGITSSGKSTLINALMGERLLPEETRATTNVLVRCRKGSERAVTSIFANGDRTTVRGAQLTADWMAKQTSERLNPSNEREITGLEWTSPGAALPEGLVLVDTPGLDACGFPEHSELVLRRLLPGVDIVLYVTSIRKRFKAADVELLEAVLEQDQRVVFLLSQIDLEQDDTEGGKVVLSRGQKLSAYVRELREDVSRGALADATVVPVSSKLALAHFYDRNSPGWTASNFSSLIRQLDHYREHLALYRLESRARRSLVLLARAASDLELALGNERGEVHENEIRRRFERIRHLRDAQRWTSAEISAVRNEWRGLLEPEYHLDRLGRELQKAVTVKNARDRYQDWEIEWVDLASRMTARMDRSRSSCMDTLRKFGLSPREAMRCAELQFEGELPPFQRYITQEPRKIRVRGWFEEISFWPQYKTFFRQDVDRTQMVEGTKELLDARLRFLNEHLTWWENRMRADYCEPLYEELAREESALAEARRTATDASMSRTALLQGLDGMRRADKGIRRLMAVFALPETDMEALPENLFDDSALRRAVFGEENEQEEGLFAPLFASFHEQNIQTRFLEIPALRQGKRLVLLGLRRHDALRLLARLAHDAALFDDADLGTDERLWLFRGSVPPALPHVSIAAPDSLLRELEVLIAPPDTLWNEENAPPVDWHDLFAEWLPVVHLDIARIDSGLSDLARAPYAGALANVGHWVVASGDGALFNSRLSDLLTDVPDRLASFMSARNFRGNADWFIYENYDARYTDFLLWGRNRLLDADGAVRYPEDDALLKLWVESGHDFKPPFSEHRMRLALERARRRAAEARSDSA